MRKVAVLATLGMAAVGMFALVSTAQATPSSPPQGSHKCLPHNVGYNSVGTLVTSSLTVDENGRYNGTIEVELSRANHGAPTGDQTFTLTAARVKFHHGVDPNALVAGSRVKLHGKVTALSKKCPQEGFTPTITVKRVDIRLTS